jgi:hypothetical protein
MDDQRAEQMRAEQLVLAGMDPEERIAALAAATCNGHDAVEQAVRLVDLVSLIGSFLDNNQREALANEMVDAAVRLICRWH